MPEGNLELELIRAHGLKDVERFGKSDPYALITCGSLKQRSKTMQEAGSNPVWNESFLFELSNDDISEILVALFDKEKSGKDEPMGTVRVPLANVFKHRQISSTRYRVQLANGNFHGELELRMKFFPKVHKGTLEVQLIDGNGLIEADTLSKSDPYAVITCDTQKQTSKVMQNAGSNPVWNQTFTFEINSAVTEIEVHLFDRDTFTADDPMGTVTVSLQRLFTNGHIPPSPYIVLGKAKQPQGEIRLGLKFDRKA